MAKDDKEPGPVVSVDIDESVQFLLKSEKEAENHSNQHQGSIYMVPSVYRDLSPQSYTPQVVSIGPLHHQDKDLKGFEVQKATYLHYLLHNKSDLVDSTPEQILKECVAKVSSSVDKIKACYVGMQTYTDSELVNMMVMDACFIFAFIYSLGDSSFSIGRSLLYPHILTDMVLIENQIPFFVLQDIFECIISKLYPESPPLPRIIFEFAQILHIFERHLVMDDSIIFSTHDHILDFLHKSYQNPDPASSRYCKMIKGHSAVELDRSGVTFSNKLFAEWPMAMKLKQSRFPCFPLSWTPLCKPTLKMPILRIGALSEMIIRNLIVYEQYATVQTCVTSYMYVMDMLIDKPEDVAVLVKSQVLVNRLSSDEKAADLINNICQKLPIIDFYYEDEWDKLDEYYKVAYLPTVIGEVKRKYFSNPWSPIALFVGIVLFVLTVVQTIYGVKDSKAA